MAQILSYISQEYHDLMDNKSDPRVNQWVLMDSPVPTLTITLIYLYIVKVLGPKYMENRKPLELKNVLIGYNLFQVLFSVWIFYESCVSGWLTHYSFKCQPVDYSMDPSAVRMTRCCWWYFISKFTEFFDTLFFVLRKKNNQVSSLHLIHHGIMPIMTWFGVKFTPGGHLTFPLFMNTFVHIIMYFYYFMAALGPQYQKFLWWKKYLTSIQISQFVIVMYHLLQLYFVECNYPRSIVYVYTFNTALFFFLFSNFYKQTYAKREKKSAVSNNNNYVLKDYEKKTSANVEPSLITQNGKSGTEADSILKVRKVFTGNNKYFPM